VAFGASSSPQSIRLPSGGSDGLIITLMNLEGWKLVISSGVQVFLGVGAWYLAFKIGRGQIEKQNEKLKIDVYEKRIEVYAAFKKFVEQ